MCFISTIIPGCVFVLVAVPERVPFPAEVRVPTAVAKTRIAVSETRPQFGKRILEERRPLTHTHVNDDWFVLLDVGLKESGISFYLFGFVVLQMNRSHMVTLSSLRETLINSCSPFTVYTNFSSQENASTDGHAHQGLTMLCLAD